MVNEKIIENLSSEYALRFSGREQERLRVWSVLVRDFFQKIISPQSTVLDLGCGYGEFINLVKAGKKFGMDLNPDAPKYLNDDVVFLKQDCSEEWALEGDCLDVVFTSNFFEHLPDKSSLSKTFEQAHRCLKSGGKIVCMGPNIRYLPGAYWDFWDHSLELTHLSLSEGLELHGFRIDRCTPKFLPYTMSNKTAPANWLISLYLKTSWIWKIKGRQFLVIGVKK